jgi:protoporphyrinogen oxidase
VKVSGDDMENDETGQWDVVVLGAGVSGLVSARILQEQGVRRILVLDRYDNAGGNHINVQAGPYTFDIGTFLFQEDSALMRYFPEILALYKPVEHSFARVTPQGRVYSYPFSVRDELLNRGPAEWLLVAVSLLWSRIRFRRIRNARDYGCYWIGKRIFVASGLENYIERFYGAPAEQIEAVFAEKRMTWIATTASVRSIVSRLVQRAKTANAQSLVRPREGFAAIYGAIRTNLEKRGASFKLGCTLRAVSRDANAFLIDDAHGAPIRTKRLISTIPLEDILALCGLQPPGSMVQTATLVSLFFSFSGTRGFSSSMLYNFSRLGKWKRITMASDFYGRANDREYFTVEVNRFGASQEEVMEEERAFREDVAAKSLFVGDLRLEGSHVLRNAYPVYGFGATAAAAESISTLRAFGIESFGRQGGFDYLPNTRNVIEAAERALG